ncbi:MAG: hypothetical protein ABT01_08175 [Clostridium sp. SCN 57-10]|nr:MAG: hypothetical protein ABT01_08175 [Clostridium sp. SCN 57-10]
MRLNQLIAREVVDLGYVVKHDEDNFCFLAIQLSEILREANLKANTYADGNSVYRPNAARASIREVVPIPSPKRALMIKLAFSLIGRKQNGAVMVFAMLPCHAADEQINAVLSGQLLQLGKTSLKRLHVNLRRTFTSLGVAGQRALGENEQPYGLFRRS